MSTSKKAAPRWELDLYTADCPARAAVTLANLRRLCDQRVPGGYRIRIVNLLETPERSRRDQIFALPTVIRRRPRPERRVIGTLSQTEAAAAALELPRGVAAP